MPQRRAITGRSQEPRLRFAEELRLLRAERGVSLRGLAEVVGWDASQFGKMENGHTLGGPEVVQALDQYYGTNGMLLTLWELAVADPTQFKERYRRYMVLEAEAVSMWHYATSNLPGVLQTPEYAAELLAQGGLAGAELEKQVAARMGRRELLLAEGGPQFRTILSETVLRSALRDPGEWQEQLRHLLAMGKRPNVIIQALPFAMGLHGLSNTDTMFLRGAGRTVAWVETGYSGELVQESTAVDQLQLRYDRVRDLALTPDKSREFIERMLEEAPCEPSI
ncbi:helix-turn-helix domain-containing protein [Streptomyces diastatochromogenes]|uniref:Transcriptional regulator n=1 Tax=Streptomyces diastatochromogenes TaxID=42236 RepID=A0A233SIE9_STRDA|nr:helix-turn-helix transcriptional regulator [Streptomyces diastatochromogenes]MCZ0988460.1 helix-turn-helix transcriptional regulator [Streptomyces diastatochromogenes]OXY95423.1 transcriptional regulator [Streptomyces diastatochromogenes]